MNKMGLFSTTPKLIKAIQVDKVQEVYDTKTGQKFLAQIGDWKVIDQNGNLFVVNYFEFIQRYSPADNLAFQMFIRKDKIYTLRGKLFNEMRTDLKGILNQNEIGDK